MGYFTAVEASKRRSAKLSFLSYSRIYETASTERQ